MKSLEELKREIARHKSEAEIRKEFVKRNAERKRLSQELMNMKHPNLAIAKDVFKSGLINASRSLAKMGNKMSKNLKKNKFKF